MMIRLVMEIAPKFRGEKTLVIFILDCGHDCSVFFGMMLTCFGLSSNFSCQIYVYGFYWPGWGFVPDFSQGRLFEEMDHTKTHKQNMTSPLERSSVFIYTSEALALLYFIFFSRLARR
ncbi:MAG: hypothetical protein IPH06_09235 [Alphaproteobacteria bacterium]|nr:hypothetical protein [Alphaproteobacteria bacterium]QQS58180.1 MAG: hypothetical protein IPN28_04995 [Alphaproteobacteria bacterium]